MFVTGDGSVQIVEMLFTTSLIALVYTTAPRKLQIVNTKRTSIICELTFPTSILAVKLNRRRLVAVLEEQIYIYDIANMKLLHTIETSPNPDAICALSPSSDNAYLAYPSPLLSPSDSPAAAPLSASSSASKGDVLLFDSLSLSVTNIVQAHRAPLSALTLSQSGQLLATSSDKGTVIRVFNVPNGERVAEFRRGSYPARIYDLAFNAVSTLLGATSDTDTVHIFKMPSATDRANGNNSSLVSRRSISPSETSQTDSMDGSTNGGGGGGGYEAFIDTKRQQQQNSAATSLRKKSLTFGRSFAASVGGGLNGLGLVPKAVSGLWEPQRDFAFLKVPISGVRSCVGFSGCAAFSLSCHTSFVLHLTALFICMQHNARSVFAHI